MSVFGGSILKQNRFLWVKIRLSVFGDYAFGVTPKNNFFQNFSKFFQPPPNPSYPLQPPFTFLQFRVHPPNPFEGFYLPSSGFQFFIYPNHRYRRPIIRSLKDQLIGNNLSIADGYVCVNHFVLTFIICEPISIPINIVQKVIISSGMLW